MVTTLCKISNGLTGPSGLTNGIDRLKIMFIYLSFVFYLISWVCTVPFPANLRLDSSVCIKYLYLLPRTCYKYICSYHFCRFFNSQPCAEDCNWNLPQLSCSFSVFQQKYLQRMGCVLASFENLVNILDHSFIMDNRYLLSCRLKVL